MFKWIEKIILNGELKEHNKLLMQRFGDDCKCELNGKTITEQLIYEKVYDKIQKNYANILKSEVDCKREITIVEAKIKNNEDRKADPTIPIKGILISSFISLVLFGRDWYKALGVPASSYNIIFNCLIAVIIFTLFTILDIQSSVNMRARLTLFCSISLDVANALNKKYKDSIDKLVKDEVAVALEDEPNEGVKYQNKDNGDITIKKNKSIMQFDKYYKDKKEIVEKEKIEKLHDYISGFYRNEIKVLTHEEKIDYIKIEKLRFEIKMGKNEGSLTKLNNSLLVGFVLAILSIYLGSEDLFKSNLGYFENTLIFIALMILFILTVGNSIKKDFNKENVSYISLKVLEEIEKELKNKKEKAEKEIDRLDAFSRIEELVQYKYNSNDEVAATRINIPFVFTSVRKLLGNKKINKSP